MRRAGWARCCCCWSFKNARENHEYLGGLFVQFMEYPLVVEVRRASWNQPDVLVMPKVTSVRLAWSRMRSTHG